MEGCQRSVNSQYPLAARLRVWALCIMFGFVKCLIGCRQQSGIIQVKSYEKSELIYLHTLKLDTVCGDT